MAYNDLIVAAQVYYPDIQIKYKDQSILMQILGKLMFFNPDFMSKYITTLGHTVYLPNQQYAINSPNGFYETFIHETVHMYDQKRFGLLYQLAYIFPQLLSVLAFLLSFLITWKIMVPIGLMFLAPWPAPWRTYFEKRAYFVQMYASNQIFNSDPYTTGVQYANWFRNGDYYWMWVLEKDADFTVEANNIKNNNPSCKLEPDLFKQVSDLINAAKK